MPHKESLPHPDPVHRFGNPSRITGLAALAALLAFAPPSRGAAPVWDPVDPALLAEQAPKIDPDAPAEAIFRRITIDDSDYPEERDLREYARYKIYAPEKATGATRITQLETTLDGVRISGRVDIRARLLLPDGTSKEFGNESIRTRSIVRLGGESWLQRLTSDNAEVDEKFLAITGMEPGAVLDVSVTHAIGGTTQMMGINLILIGPIIQPLQLPVPIRRLEFRHEFADSVRYGTAPFLLNGPPFGATFDLADKGRAVVVRASNLPALVKEPLSGPAADYALTYISDAIDRHGTYIAHNRGGGNHIYIDRKAGPWAGLATKAWLGEDDMAVPTRRLKKLTAQLVAGAATETEKAARIHRFVQDRYWQFVQAAHRQRLNPRTNLLEMITSVDEILDAAQHPDYSIPPIDFTWLALTLYRIAGLEAQAVMLPNRAFVEFDPRLVADMFLPNRAVRVRVDGHWEYSCQTVPAPIAFGMLPWNWTGLGLVIQANKQEFVAAPITPPEESNVTNSGKFELAEDGTLSGEGRRVFTGQPAYLLRLRFRRASPDRQKAIVRRMLQREFKTGKIEVLDMTGAADPDAPLAVSFHLDYPDFATLTKERMIFRPEIFHIPATSFTASARHYPLRFSFPVSNRDEVEIHFPAEYRVETKWAPPSLPGDLLSYVCRMSYMPKRGIFLLDRTFVANLAGVPVKDYAGFKAWNDLTESSEDHDLVLVRSARADGAAKSAPPPEKAPGA